MMTEDLPDLDLDCGIPGLAEVAPLEPEELGSVLEAFSQHEVSHLPVTMTSRPNHVIGLISRVGLMKKYHRALAEGK